MKDSKKKYILIIIIILVNIFCIILAAKSVLKSIKIVFENGEVSSITKEPDKENADDINENNNIENDGEIKEDTTIPNIEPTVNVQSKLVNDNPTFVIDIQDDNIIATVKIIHNGGDEKLINVNKETYYDEIVMSEGLNTIIVTAIDDNGVEKTRRVKFENM